MISSHRVTVTNASAAQLNTDNPGWTSSGSIIVKNPTSGAATVDVGGSGVMAGAGYELAPGMSMSLDTTGNEDVYAISQGANVTLQVLQGGLIS